MKDTSRHLGLFAMISILLVVGCDSPGASSSDGAAGGIDVQIEAELASQIQSTAANWERGDGRVDARVEIENLGAEPVTFHAQGDWSTASGAGRGGQSGSYTVQPGQSVDVALSTRSSDVGSLRLQLTAAPLSTPVALADAPPLCSESPAAEIRTPIKGWVGGGDFRAASTLFIINQRTGEHQMKVSDHPVKTLIDLALWVDKRQVLRLDLPSEPSAGAVLEHPFGAGGGFFQVLEAGKERTTSWNTKNGWRLVIDKWQWTQPAQPVDTPVGVATGRVEVCYPGSGGIPTSWVGGAFSAEIYVISP